MSEGNRQIESVAVIGGGVAGLAAAQALSDSGYKVRLIERRPYVGGRASSYEHPGIGEIIDNCQHLLFGCCTNLIDLYRRIGALDKLHWFDAITMIEPGGRRTVLSPSALPAPWHASPGFLKAHAFSLADKIAIARGLNTFITGIPEDTKENFYHWLIRHKQTQAAIKRFWEPVLFAALNEELDKTSVHYAAKVCRELFLRSPEAGRMAIPSVPLSDLYGHALQSLKMRGADINLRASVTRIAQDDQTQQWAIETEAERFISDAVIFAVPFEAMARLLPTLPAAPGKDALTAHVSQFSHAPIAAIHLWFDREITDLEHASMLDTTIQWLFNKSKLQPQRHGQKGHYIEVVISVLRSVIPMQRQELIDLAVRELALFFPTVREAKLLKGAVTKEVRATFSVPPGIDKIRPTAQSPWPNIFLAGDWTATGWPATMEGAARSGFLAAEALSNAAGRPEKFLQPDLPPSGLMRLFT
ncbi:FAD-dependent oxidoreductase [Alloacidobacterium dinghuense]|uniref:FAD-dependent oxidoreductase n=1 Tax=Alloacidobacterium dinghuense TaxID=2763107 RepID=A0A7G8BKC4_9BACT|nr:hydroxysqualene dehydroxylase HpnE [Alloacidobacterium dinghuense]QNI32994.1 FAD-dependent oxidoreductase [Alloacidobacterium dinghuense]